MGNFSISHYAAITLRRRRSIELRYLIDMAEIPTFQEIQDGGIAPAAGHPSLDAYLARKAEALKDGLYLEVNGEPARPRSPPRATSSSRRAPGACRR